MKVLRAVGLGVMCGWLTCLGSGVAAAQAPVIGVEQIEPADFFRSRDRATVRVGQDYTLKAGDVVRHVVVISGTATIDGTVNGDVAVIFGNTRIGSTAVIRGSLVVVAGGATVAEGAVVRGDLVVVGGSLDTPPGFLPGGEHVVVGSTWLGDRLRTATPWFTRGLLWGRVIVPDLRWVWMVAGIFLILSLGLNLLFHGPVAACARTLADKPFSTFLAGLLVLVLAGPMSVLLAVTVVGVVVVPFLWCALLVAGMVGKVGVARWIGRSLTGQGDPESRLQGVRSFLLGIVAIYFLYMLPVVGLVTWALVGVFGIGAASRAFLAALRRERPAKPAAPARPAKSSEAATAAMASAPVPYVASFVPPPPPPPPPQFHEAPMSSIDSVAAPSGAATTDLRTLPRATFLDRLAAFVLDVALVLIACGLLDVIRFNGASAFFLMLFGYFVAFWAWKGTTIGGIICNLRVVRADGHPLRFADALVRGLASLFSFAALGIGCLWILLDSNPHKQAWHDIIAGTYVVRVPRDRPLP